VTAENLACLKRIHELVGKAVSLGQPGETALSVPLLGQRAAAFEVEELLASLGYLAAFSGSAGNQRVAEKSPVWLQVLSQLVYLELQRRPKASPSPDLAQYLRTAKTNLTKLGQNRKE